MASGVSQNNSITPGADLSAMREDGLVKDRNVVASPLSSGMQQAPGQKDSERIEVPHEHIDWETDGDGIRRTNRRRRARKQAAGSPCLTEERPA